VVDGSGLALASGPAITANPTVDWDEPRQRFTVFWDNTSTVATGELEGADVSVLGVASGHTSYGPGRMPLVRYSAAGPGLFGSNQFMPAPDHNFRAWLRLAGKRGAGATCTMDAQCLSGLCLSSGCAVSLDAGVPDAGADAGSVDAGGALEDGGVDAGLRDAGAESDAGPASDAGVESDAGPTNDAGQVSDAGPASDAGLMSDAGPASDAGPTSDAGLMSDAGAAGDAGTFASDAGLQSREPHTLQVGCGCDTSPASLLWALVLVLATRRR
jgi:MYXO-CTERM domain-containing protein